LWAYALIWSTITAYAMFFIDEDLLEERFHPPTAGADGVALAFRQGSRALASCRGGARFRPVAHHLGAARTPRGRAGPHGRGARDVFPGDAREPFLLVGRAGAGRARHRVVDSGPYSIVRHPGYAGLIWAIPFSGLALGSWLAAGIGLLMSGMILRRVLFEDAFLNKNLVGYAAYSGRVRHRLIPGVW
jgi:hypothetical protein